MTTSPSALQNMLHHAVCFPVLQWWYEGWLCLCVTILCVSVWASRNAGIHVFAQKCSTSMCDKISHTHTHTFLLPWWDSKLSNRWIMTNPSGRMTIPLIVCLQAHAVGWIVQSWSVADAWGDDKPRRSFLQYYLEYWDLIAPNLIDFSQVGMKEGQRVSLC